MKLTSTNPSTYKPLGEVDVSSLQDIQQKVALAHEAKTAWRDLGLQGRIAALRNAFHELKQRGDEFALLQSREMGMPLAEALQDVDGNLDYANWYFDNAEKYLGPETTFQDDKEIQQVFYEPISIFWSKASKTQNLDLRTQISLSFGNGESGVQRMVGCT